MFENLEFEDQTTLSPINDTGGAYSMVKKKSSRNMLCHCMILKSALILYEFTVSITARIEGFCKDMSPTCLSRILTLKTMISFLY